LLHIRLIEMEAEKLAREEAERALKGGEKQLPHECELIKCHIEEEVGLKLAQSCASDFRGWLTYRRLNGDLVIIRGRAFQEASSFMFGAGKWKAGLDVPFGLDTVRERQRGFDVSPPQALDHLMVNFGMGKSSRVFLWYGENIAPYRLIFEEELQEIQDLPVGESPQKNLMEALSEGMGWILNKPRELTLPEYIKQLKPKPC